ncbi:hypothetical protein M409DRAFT_60895 [Zasmidium cellare ATCC 36951]|uniref:F-box domain-containing protein n=1 Tax=Zasmidium cellare ATCC 36951 TaxID=1080233 RepID=A0A6A6C0H8_ZASCE|nr:uncharacterized protein M409DRAFT_60895 [Zasmidium cellare ATCC 36951]KAF2159309.1 hypothetical protein M409DRAFT_60895 [Zasmidium cellare ATCC 36951]
MSTSPEPRPSRADLTYPYPNLKDNSLDENHLDQTCPLDIGRHQLEPVHDLGDLDRLPCELIDQILAQIYLRCLFDFRRVNQRAMQAVDGIPEFKQIVKHHLVVIRAVLAIEVASRISCIQLLQTLKTPNCTHCGDFAGYIYALDCRRVCFLCFTKRTDLLPLTARQVFRKFGLDSSLLLDLPRLRSVPGCYSPNEKNCRKRVVLYDPDSAHRAGVALHGSQAAMMEFAASTLSSHMDEYENRKHKYFEKGFGRKPRRPAGAGEEHDGLSGNARRFMGIRRLTGVTSAFKDIIAVNPCTALNEAMAKGRDPAAPSKRRRRRRWLLSTPIPRPAHQLVKKLRTNVYEAKVPSLAENAIAKFARFSWEIDHIDQECAAYQWIASHEIGPNFLGNIVEEQRVIGFVSSA